jgi:hypothetical protein
MTVTIVLALANLGDTTQMEMILLAMASKEGDIPDVFAYNVNKT